MDVDIDYENSGIPATAQVFNPADKTLSVKCHLNSLNEYHDLYSKSVNYPENFWRDMALEHLSWERPFKTVMAGSFSHGDVSWFPDGAINACVNCVDRHALKTPEKIAFYWEGDDPSEARSITYGELLRDVCRFANGLKQFGLRKGDAVAIYLPMIPEAAISMLACARLGLIHSVIFAGFSSSALSDRINDAQCKLLITCDEGRRGGKSIKLKDISDQALLNCSSIQNVVVVRRTGTREISFLENRDVWWHDLMVKFKPVCPPESLNSEETLFLLYTSGSTGKPKGVAHTTAGYLLYATLTVKYVFDTHENDIFGCMADIGWITGHSYFLYGPLSNGLSVVMFESTPFYPNPSRYWSVVEKYKITHFYTSPTAIRALRKEGSHHIDGFDLSSIRVLGSVGEPINPDAWLWYHKYVGREQCTIVDTYWQTETGGIVITPLASVTPTKPGSATLPFFGIVPVILDPQTGKELDGGNVSGVLAIKKPWPSVTRSIYGDHERYMKTYFEVYRGYYFTGDSASRDADGYYWIKGRVDDVINVSGHRLSTAEIESALVHHPNCAEAAVIGKPDDVCGQVIFAFCIINCAFRDGISMEFIKEVRRAIGPIATPKEVIIVPDLPKTRSGKIMRRLLRKISVGETSSEQLGDLTTLADTSVVQKIIDAVKVQSRNA